LAQRFVDDKASNERIVNSIPARRWGKPQDFKGIAVFLASEASDYVNGARIFVDGGTHGM
jgi:NAD(P)-dependent dehydrogenase (short-subunit alcohol dehydrogenase family)